MCLSTFPVLLFNDLNDVVPLWQRNASVPLHNKSWSAGRGARQRLPQLVQNHKLSTELYSIHSNLVEALKVEVSAKTQPHNAAIEYDYKHIDSDEIPKIGTRGLAAVAKKFHILEVFGSFVDVENVDEGL